MEVSVCKLGELWVCNTKKCNTRFIYSTCSYQLSFEILYLIWLPAGINLALQQGQAHVCHSLVLYASEKVLDFYTGSGLKLHSTHMIYLKKKKSESLWLNKIFSFYLSEWILQGSSCFFYSYPSPISTATSYLWVNRNFISTNLFFTSKKWII